MKISPNLSIILASVALLAACSSTPKVNEAPKQAPVAVVLSNSNSQAPVIQPKVQSIVIPPYLDPKNELATKRSIWFDYNVFAIKPEFNQMLQLHGKYLASNPKVAIRVEGNADERGSSEYNLALGQKRADSVVRALKVFGATDAQLEAVSFGKEKPKADGHDEAAWAENRRVDLAYPTK